MTIRQIKTSSGDSHEIKALGLPFGTCTDAADAPEKTVRVDVPFSNLEAGTTIIVKFTNENSIASPTLNVNETGAKPIKRYGTTAVSTGTTTTGWTAGAIQMFTYDGENWVRDYWSNTTYSNASLGQGYATCSTSPATAAKTASLSSYSLTTGGIVAVKFTNGNTASSPTLNINGKGAKSIYYGGSKLTNTSLIEPGDIVTFVYSTYYYIISIDKAGYVGTPTTATSTLSSGNTFTAVTDIDISGYYVKPTVTTYTLPGDSDTKNTAGSTDSSSKLFLVGATSQDANPQTYSHDTAYVGTDGCLYSNSTKVSVEGHTHSGYANQNAFSNVTVGSTTIAADSTTDTLTLAEGTNVTLTPDATNDKITINSSGTDVTLNGTSKSGSTASFYAPTEAGTSGYFLRSQGSGAPKWSSILDMTYGGTGANMAATQPNAIIRCTSAGGYMSSTPTKNGAFYATSANGSPQFGTLPIAQGGTGATGAAAARTNLGITYGTEVPTTAPSTGNGSIYFFEDELGTIPISEGGTGAITAEAALANLGGVKFKVLWENSDTSAKFAAQTITLPETADFYMIMTRNHITSYSTNLTNIFIDGTSTFSFSAANTSSNNIYSRTYSISGNILDVDDCYRKAMSSTTAGTTKYNEYFIPWKIYGVKGVLDINE